MGFYRAWYTIRSAFAWLRDEGRAARPVFLFFLVGFLLVLVIVKLALARYSIEISTLSRALVGALVAAKVTLLLDETSLAHSFKRYPRIFGITLQTMVYGLAVILLGVAEKMVDAYRHLGAFGAAWQDVSHRMEIHQLLAIALGTSLIFAAYFVLSEVDRSMGEGALWAMLFESPADADRPLPPQPQGNRLTEWISPEPPGTSGPPPHRWGFLRAECRWASSWYRLFAARRGRELANHHRKGIKD